MIIHCGFPYNKFSLVLNQNAEYDMLFTFDNRWNKEITLCCILLFKSLIQIIQVCFLQLKWLEPQHAARTINEAILLLKFLWIQTVFKPNERSL